MTNEQTSFETFIANQIARCERTGGSASNTEAAYWRARLEAVRARG